MGDPADHVQQGDHDVDHRQQAQTDQRQPQPEQPRSEHARAEEELKQGERRFRDHERRPRGPGAPARRAAAVGVLLGVTSPLQDHLRRLGRLDSGDVRLVDVHFHFQRALEAIEAGVHKIRLNPGNIRRPEHIKAVAAEFPAIDLELLREAPSLSRLARDLLRPFFAGDQLEYAQACGDDFFTDAVAWNDRNGMGVFGLAGLIVFGREWWPVWKDDRSAQAPAIVRVRPGWLPRTAP